MKILYVVDYYQPQLGYSEYFIPRELSRLGHTVSILTSNFYYPFPNYAETSGRLLGPRKQRAGLSWQDSILVIKETMVSEIFTRSIFFNHEKYIHLLQPDLVIVNKSAGFNTIRMSQLKQKYGYKLLSYDAHLPSGFYAVGNIFLKKIFYSLFRFLFADLLNSQVDKFIAVQEKTVDIMKEFYGQKDIVHIPLGTDTEIFHYDNLAGAAIRRKYKIPTDAFVIGYSGKLIPTKGIHLLCAAFQKIASKYKDAYLMLVGNGTDEYLSKCFENVDKKYHNRIITTGFQTNATLYKYYSTFNVGVWPLEESTAMNDVAACGVPFIANDQVGATIRFSRNNASKYRKGNSDDLARQIEFYINHPKERKAMGKRGLSLIQDTLSWPMIVKKYLSYVE